YALPQGDGHLPQGAARAGSAQGSGELYGAGGMSSGGVSERLERAFAPVRELIDAGRIPGAVLGVVDAKGNRAVTHAGRAQIVPSERAMQEDTWFDLASLSKV